jgi:hypothetical protein
MIKKYHILGREGASQWEVAGEKIHPGAGLWPPDLALLHCDRSTEENEGLRSPHEEGPEGSSYIEAYGIPHAFVETLCADVANIRMPTGRTTGYISSA